MRGSFCWRLAASNGRIRRHFYVAAQKAIEQANGTYTPNSTIINNNTSTQVIGITSLPNSSVKEIKGTWNYNADTNTWAFAKQSGGIAIGWNYINSNGKKQLYLFDFAGILQVGWKKIGAKLFYFSESAGPGYGAAQVSWTYVYGIPCHFNETTYELDSLNGSEVLTKISKILVEQAQGKNPSEHISQTAENLELYSKLAMQQ